MKTWKVTVAEGDERIVQAELSEVFLRDGAKRANFYIGDKIVRYFYNYDKIEFLGGVAGRENDKRGGF